MEKYDFTADVRSELLVWYEQPKFNRQSKKVMDMAMECTGINLYKTVIRMERQVEITNKKNNWANADPQIYRRCDQVPRRSKNPLLTGHTSHEPSL
jgi:hypothetical protein